ncbi:MAG: phosphonate metabolism protein/1,5-bisphosphokinase (PRPP-forming) PhnN [Pseudomonadota bacterium]
MTGQLIAVVGPSGAGKDTVMAALVAARPGLSLVRRVITRDADAGGEDFEAVTEAAFAQMVAQGAFALHWRAHGLAYGIPAAALADLDAGQDLVVNLSRSVLAEAQGKVSRFAVVSLTVAPEVLAQRLAARGRESAADIEARLARSGAALPPGLPVIEIDNSGPVQETVRAILTALYPVSA